MQKRPAGVPPRWPLGHARAASCRPAGAGPGPPGRGWTG